MNVTPEFGANDPMVVMVAEEFFENFIGPARYMSFSDFVRPYADLWNAEYGHVVSWRGHSFEANSRLTTASFKFSNLVDFTFFKLTFGSEQLVPPGKKDPHSCII